MLIRPSYVLSGAAMNVVSNREELEHFLTLATNVSKQYPVVVTEFIEHAKEIEIDAVAKNGEMLIYAISEHVEFAGRGIRATRRWFSRRRKCTSKRCGGSRRSPAKWRGC